MSSEAPAGGAADSTSAGASALPGPPRPVPGPPPATIGEASDPGAEVRRQVAALAELDQLPLSEHAERYGEVHATLQAALTEIDGKS